MNYTILRAVLALVGLVVIFLGVNVGFGGILTLGWQGPNDFVLVVNTDAFAIQDSHMRFLGGVWIGVGLGFLAGATAPDVFKPILITLCALAFIGGLARLSSGFGTLTSGSVAPSLFAELVLFPALGWWIIRSVTPRR